MHASDASSTHHPTSTQQHQPQFIPPLTSTTSGIKTPPHSQPPLNRLSTLDHNVQPSMLANPRDAMTVFCPPTVSQPRQLCTAAPSSCTTPRKGTPSPLLTDSPELTPTSNADALRPSPAPGHPLLLPPPLSTRRSQSAPRRHALRLILLRAASAHRTALVPSAMRALPPRLPTPAPPLPRSLPRSAVPAPPPTIASATLHLLSLSPSSPSTPLLLNASSPSPPPPQPQPLLRAPLLLPPLLHRADLPALHRCLRPPLRLHRRFVLRVAHLHPHHAGGRAVGRRRRMAERSARGGRRSDCGLRGLPRRLGHPLPRHQPVRRRGWC